MSKTDVVVKEDKANLPTFMSGELDEVAGLGNSSDPSDSSLPFLALIQSGSPQIKEENAKFIEGAKTGFIFNTATKQFWPARVSKAEDGVVVVPCGYSKHFVEWKPARGGYVTTHPFDFDFIKKLGAKKEKVIIEGKEREVICLPNGNILTETAYTFVLIDGLPAVIGAASTALGTMRDWMSYRKSLRMNGKELPSFAKEYRLRTALQSKDNNEWYNWTFNDVGFIQDRDLYEAAKVFAIAVSKGEVQVGRPDFFEESSNDQQQAGGSRGTMDDQIPV
jgi:hypothetical protein